MELKIQYNIKLNKYQVSNVSFSDKENYLKQLHTVFLLIFTPPEKTSSSTFLRWMPGFRIANVTLPHVALGKGEGLAACPMGDVSRSRPGFLATGERGGGGAGGSFHSCFPSRIRMSFPFTFPSTC